MHLSATALIALLQAAGVDNLVEAAPVSTIGHAAASVTSISTPQAPQGKAGDGSVRRAMAA
jgi:hypothetical protein